MPVPRAVGPIAAVILGPDDPSIRTALAIAAAAKERVIALAPLGSNAREATVDMADAAGVGPAGDRRAATIASLRAIPVLLTHT
jgi:hypothetical protein